MNSNHSGQITTLSETTTISTYQSQEDLSQHLHQQQPHHHIESHHSIDVIDELYDYFSHDAGLEDIHAFETNEKQYRKRQALIQQLFDSESDYVNRLHATIQYFQRPIIMHFDQFNNNNTNNTNSNNNNSGSITIRPFLLNRTSLSSNISVNVNDVNYLFNPIEKLYQLHENFLEKLTQRFQIWGPTQFLSDLINDLISELSLYDSYLENYPRMMAILEILGKSKDARKFTEAVVNNPGGIGQVHLFSLLELPLYTVSRYHQLLSDIVKFTDPNHPDASRLKKVQLKIQRIELGLKSRIAICKNISQLMDMSLTVKGCPLMMDQPRQIIKSGKLGSIEGNNKQHDLRICFLLSDQLITARPGDGVLQFKSKVHLKGATIKTVKRMDASFVIVEDSSDPTYQFSEDIEALLNASGTSPPRQYHFKAESLDDMLSWLRDLQNVVSSIKGFSK
ncbi:Dbl homology domain-containing protein [Cunninghamella echinulata]|nr:Dbl homology domain-containing protein [Cunninghamella echinulata]